MSEVGNLTVWRRYRVAFAPNMVNIQAFLDKSVRWVIQLRREQAMMTVRFIDKLIYGLVAM